MSLSERIKEQRKKCGMSQEKVAELMGVSRQAVTKWETGQSAPSTENLFKLAEIFGTTTDILLVPEEHKTEEVKKAEALSIKQKKNLTAAFAVFGGYMAIYLLGRVFGTDPKQLSYLYGWLLNRKLFWLAMAISVIPALFGKYRFSFTTLSMFGIGLLLGELLGKNPAGVAYGQSHYGWVIWSGIFILSFIMGAVAEKLWSKQPFTLKSKGVMIWCAALLIGIIAIVSAVKGSIPQI